MKDKIQIITDKGVNNKREEDICEIFNKNFQSVLTKENDFQDELNGNDSIEILEEINICKKMVVEELKALDTSKADGPDGISGWVLKECVEELSGPLTKIFKHSLEKGTLPEYWKWANIVPQRKEVSKIH